MSGSRRRRDLGAALAPVLFLCLLAGCAPRQTRIVLPEELPFEAMDASREELLAKLEAQSGTVDTLQATVNYVATGSVVGDTGEVSEETNGPIRGGLVVEWPSLIRMNGNTTLGLISGFDMSADDEEFRLSVPASGKFYHGLNDGYIEGEDENPLLKLRAHYVTEGLLVDVREYLSDPQVVRSFAEMSEGRRLFYVFSFIDASGPQGLLLERIWIDRRDLEVARKQVFDKGGVLEMQVQYDLHQDVGGIMFPHRVVIERLVEGASLQIDFLEPPELNTEIAEALLVVRYPPGAESIRIGDPESTGEDADIEPAGSSGAGSVNAVN